MRTLGQRRRHGEVMVTLVVAVESFGINELKSSLSRHLGIPWQFFGQVTLVFKSAKGIMRYFSCILSLDHLQMCQGLNSHYFHIIGDGHQPNSRGL